MPRSTASGRIWLACTMGIRPKINAVKKPIATPPSMVMPLEPARQLQEEGVLHDLLDEIANAHAGRRADDAADQSQQARLQPKERIEVACAGSRPS